jgi:NAD-reducing hydrogenase large subunit
LPEARATTLDALARFKQLCDSHREEVEVFGNFSSLFLGLVQPDGTWEHYDGIIRVVDDRGQILADRSNPADYRDLVGEAVEDDSYLKSPYYKPFGYPQGVYRVGPLARLNICTKMGSPLADRELAEFHQRGGDVVNASFLYHHARLVEVLAALERIERLLDDTDLSSDWLRAQAGINRLEGVGVSEAPRGTLFHHYQVDDNGLLQKVNLVIATGQNALAMNRAITQIAKHYIKGTNIPEPLLNRVEAGIRAFDPCLSCSTHATGQMPLVVQLFDTAGQLLDEARR